MRRSMLLAAGALATSAAVAMAAPGPDTVGVTGKATAGGTKAKPKVVSAGFSNTANGPNGDRAQTPKSLSWKWVGIKTNGGAFPTCTTDVIDAAQSDASCPKGSLVGTGKIAALLGPDGADNSGGITCNKNARVYNAGKGKETLYIYGDAAACAGVAYLPPIPLVSQSSSTGETIVFDVPDNIGSPLPGLRGSIVNLAITYNKLSVKKGKKKVGYLTSTGCGKAKTRTVTFTTTYANYDPSTVAASAGSC